MRIVLQKGSGAPDQLICHREDGSTLSESLSPGSAYHDLAHFAVESALGLREGFWGMIAQGFSLAEYNLPNEERPFQITKEGYAAEFLATLVQSAVPTGEISTTYLAMLQQACLASALPFPDLPKPEVLDGIIAHTQQLTKVWSELGPGEEMGLTFGGYRIGAF